MRFVSFVKNISFKGNFLNFISSVGCENRGVLTAIRTIRTDLRIGVKFKTQVFMGKSYR